MLSDYFSGHLENSQRETVEGHLGHCGTCSRSLALMQLLGARQEEVSSPQHPSPELLTQFYESKGSLDPGAADDIEAHLQGCKECEQVVAFLTDLEQQLRESVAKKPRTWSVTDRLIAIIRRPVLSYSMITVLLFAGGTWIYRSVWQGRAGDGQHIQQAYRLSESLRTGGSVPEIKRALTSGAVPIQISFYTAPAGAEYGFVVTNTNETRILPSDVPADFSEKGFINLELTTDSLADGHYTLLLLEVSGSSPSDTTKRRYPFILKTEE